MGLRGQRWRSGLRSVWIDFVVRKREGGGGGAVRYVYLCRICIRIIEVVYWNPRAYPENMYI